MIIVPVEGVLMPLALIATLLTFVGFVSLLSLSICRGLLQKKRHLTVSRDRRVIGFSARYFPPSPKEPAITPRGPDRALTLPGQG